jgi:N-acetylglucosamine-6-phosphate deacetylase
MLGISNQKGILKPDVDADLVVLDEHLKSDGTMQLEVDQVWKFGTKVFDVTDIGSPFHDCLRCDQ